MGEVISGNDFKSYVFTFIMMKKLSLAFDFVLDELFSLDPIVKPMFGCHAVYIGEKIMLVTRERNDHSQDNGVWVATTREHHESLKKEFPSLRSITVLGSGETQWQNIPADAVDFEESVLRICKRIRNNDKRIGKIPARKKSRKKT